MREIHRRYFDAGADICETNTFSGTVIAQADYGMEHIVYELNKLGCELAVDAAKEVGVARSVPAAPPHAVAPCTTTNRIPLRVTLPPPPARAHPSTTASQLTAKEPHRPRLVAGAIGPTNRTLSISPSVEDPGYRNCTWDEIVAAYKTQIAGLIDGGAHILLVETIFDTLNAKAALFAIDEYYEESGCPRLPIMVSGTIVDMSGRTLSGQTTEAFYVSMQHAKPICIGLNCALGADQMLPFMQALSGVAECFVHSYPNAGLPNAMGGYDETPEGFAKSVKLFLDTGLVNALGGCCGTTPDHIRAVDQMLQANKQVKPRVRPLAFNEMRISGLESLTVDKNLGFMNVGERCACA